MSFSGLQAEYFAGANAGKKVIEVIVGDDDAKKAIAIGAGLLEEAVVVEVAELDDIVIKVGEALKLPATVKATLSDGKEADVAVTWPEIDTSKAMEKTEFQGTIADTDVVAKINVTIEVDALLVEDVYADNLVEVNVVFNQDVSDNAEVAKKDNYKLSVGTIGSVKVDGNIATIALAIDQTLPKNQTPAKLTVNDKILGSKEEFEFNYFDATLPEVEDIEITGPKSLIVNFTEPMNPKVKGKISLKLGSSTLSVNTSPDFKGSAITVPLYSTLADGKTYTITITDFEDFAEYKNVVKTIEFVYEKDETPPVATIDEATQEYVKVTFNKPVKGLTPEHFSHTFSAYTALQLSKKEAYPLDEDGKAKDDYIGNKDSVKTVYVYFHGMITDSEGKGIGLDKDKVERPIPEGESNFRIRTKAGDDEIKDEWGNKFADETYVISVAADKVAPEIKSLKVKTEDSLEVEFTKTVTFKNANIEILDPEGKKIDGVKADVQSPGNGKKFTVKFGKKLAGKSILVNIKNIEDTTLNSNKMADYSEVLEVTDKTAPKINKVAYKGDSKDEKGTLYVFFNESMDSDTALKVSNYYLYDGDKYTKLSEDIAFFEGDKVVEISLTKDQYTIAKATSPKNSLFVTGVKDIAGNEIAPGIKEIDGPLSTENVPGIAYIDDEITSKGLKVYATATDKIEVTFNQELTNIDDEAFTVSGLDVVGMDVEVSGGVTKAILTVEKVDGEIVTKLPYNPTGTEVTLKANVIENAFGTKNETATTYVLKPINDKIAPAVKKADSVQDEKNIIIVFTENVNFDVSGDLAASDFTIINKSDDDKKLTAGTDYTLTKDEGPSDKIVIELSKDYRGSKLNVALNENGVGYIKDGNKNKLAKFDKDFDMKKAEVTFSFNVKDKETLTAGVPLELDVTTKVKDNNAVAKNTPLLYKIVIKKDASKLEGDLTITSTGADESSEEFTIKDGEGNFGPGGGFTLNDIPALLTSGGRTTKFTTTLDAGEYSITVSLLDISGNEGLELGKGTVTFTVKAAVEP